MNRFSLRIFLLLVITSTILGLVTYQVTGSIENMIGQSAKINKSNQMLLKLNAAVLQVRDMQAVTRGFVLTGDDKLRDRYQYLTATLELALDTMERASLEDSTQHARLQRLAEIIRNHAENTREVMHIYNEQGPKAGLDQLRKTVTTNDDDQIVPLINQIDSDEQKKLVDYREQSSQALASTLKTSVIGVAGCVAIFLFLFWMIDREGVRRSKNERSLQGLVTKMELIQQEMQEIGHLIDYLQSCREVEEIYALIKERLPLLFPKLSGTLAIYNNSRNIIEMVTSWQGAQAPADLSENTYFLPEECWALRRGAIHLVTGAGKATRCSHASHNHSLDTACLPMNAHGETIGVLNVAAQPGELDEHLLQVLHNLSEHLSMAIANMQFQKALRIQTLRDPLTQLYNRRFMETTLEREIFRARRKKEPISVIMIDIDHFKKLNDQHGHEAGDYVLREFAQLLQQAVRTEDVACRYGGEEFILIMSGASIDIAIDRAEKLRIRTAQNKFMFNGTTIKDVTLSLGIATYPEHSEDPHQLIKLADNALYRAKHAGRNRYEIAMSLKTNASEEPIKAITAS